MLSIFSQLYVVNVYTINKALYAYSRVASKQGFLQMHSKLLLRSPSAKARFCEGESRIYFLYPGVFAYIGVAAFGNLPEERR